MGLFFKGLFVMLMTIFLFPQMSWAIIAPDQVDFTDVSGHWAKQSIEKINAVGLVNGFPDNTFRPDQPVSCLEAITMVMNGAGFRDQIAKVKRIKGATPSAYPVPWGQSDIDFAVKQKFIPEAVLKNFRTDRPINRGELAALLVRAFYLTGQDGMNDDETVIQTVYSNGLMSGYPDGSFRPQGQVSRGEMAAILAELYQQGWIHVDPKRKITGWVSRVAQVKNGLEIEVNSPNGTQKVLANPACKGYWQGQKVELQQAVNYRVEVLLDTKRKAAYIEFLERRNFSPVRKDVYASYLRMADGEPVILTLKDLLGEEVDYPIAWDAEIIDEKSKGKATKNRDLLKKLKVDQFVKLGLTSNETIKSMSILDVKKISGKVDRVGRTLVLERKSTGSSKKYEPDEFWGWDSGRLVDKDGEEISTIKVGDSVTIIYIGEPFYERVLEIQRQ